MSRRWGPETDKAIENFAVSGEPVPWQLITALAMIKAEAAEVNRRHGVIDDRTADAIVRAAQEIASGAMADQFPVDVFQTGSGTSTNMNVNEVIAHRASELAGTAVHPNDHVNASQSSNDTFPSAMRIAAVVAVSQGLMPALAVLAEALRQLSAAHGQTVKLARTHLMDAVPMTFGQEVGGWARAVELGGDRLTAALPRVSELPLGGTAAGTGLNAPAGFGDEMARRLSARTGLAFVEAVDHFEAQSTQDALIELSGVLKVVALSVHKIAGDLRLLSSGPAGGLAELSLPTVQAGSSIMPGKVNPVIAEMIQQVAAQVVGNDAAVTFAAAACSNLQLTTAMPVIARNLLSSIDLLGRSVVIFAERCVQGVRADAPRMLAQAESSAALVTALAPTMGYDAAAALVAEASGSGETVSDLLARRGQQFDMLALADPSGMAGSPGGMSGTG
jgi:fumarate hydratase class II